ncbi:MAG: hypothetical protein P9L99_20235 [Candidatus Lernaella stagnicola]|nr:hypothetical protein [Candidatus Lernaella stagnicola]
MLEFHQARQRILDFDDTTDVEKWPAHLALGRALAIDFVGPPRLARGTTLRPAHQAMLTQGGMREIPTYGQVGVGLTAVNRDLTGNELPPDVEPHPGLTALAAAAQTRGVMPVDVGQVPDRADLHLAAVRRAFEVAEFVCTIGASPETAAAVAHDFDGKLEFTEVGHTPSELSFVPTADGFWFGLPSEPSAALALFHLYVLPAARRFAGHAHFDLPTARVKVSTDLAEGPPRWVWGRLGAPGADFRRELLDAPLAMSLAAAVTANALVLLGDTGGEPGTAPVFVVE